ncbi:cation:proton antiporter [Chloroflexota bacterium]
MVEEFALVKDFAIIMAVAGAATLLFRRLGQPPVLGYLITGVLIGPYALPVPPVTDIHTIRLLADLGLVLLLFGLGLEFSWSKIRQIGLSVLIIGALEITIMISLGYGLGRVLGWPGMDALFLGAALHISNSAIIVKVLRDLGKLNLLSSKLIVGILVVEDFAAVIIIAVLSGMATTDIANIGDIGLLMMKLGIFIVASLAFGALVVPKIIRFTHQFHSPEALLITSLGLCFAMALFSKYLGLSVAAGAFLMGAIVGDTEHSEEIIETVTPIRDMFAALFFVAIGMLINVAQVKDFIGPAIIVSIVFMLGKIFGNTLATSITGHDNRTTLQVGMGMPQMGEFSLAIAKVGIDRGVVTSPLYSVIAVATAITTLLAPYVTRSADTVAEFLNRRSPALLKGYLTSTTDWLQALHITFSRQGATAIRVRAAAKPILINLIIIVVLIWIGTLVLQFADDLARFTRIREDVIAMLLGFFILVLCIPPIIFMWRNLRSLIDEASRYVLSRRATAKMWGREALQIVLRDSIVVVISIFVALWLIPFISRLLFIGSIALTIPLLLLAFFLYILLRSVRQIHGQLERTFGQVLLGEEYASTSEAAQLLGVNQSTVVRSLRRMKLPGLKIGRRWHVHRAELEALAESQRGQKEESNDNTQETDSGADTPN